MASNDKIQVYRAEAVTLSFTVRASDDAAAPAADITGWTLSFTVATEYNQAPPKSVTKAVAVTDGPNGRCTVTLTAAELNLTIGRYVYDLWRTDTGQERPLAVGIFDVLPSARVPTA